MVIDTLINSIILMSCLMLIGFYLGKKGIINDETENSLSYILVNITAPAMVINTFTIEFSLDKLKSGAFLFGLAIIFNVGLILLAKIATLKISDKNKKNVIKYAVVMMNGGFMGYPIINQLFGAEGMFYASMFYTPGTIFMWTYGLSVFLDGRKDESRYKKMFLNPGMVGVYVGLIIYVLQIPIPSYGKNLLSLLTNMTTVISMFIIGRKISVIGVKNAFMGKEAYYAAFLRLIVSPVIMILFLKYFNLSDMIKQIYIIYSALPVAVMMPIMAKSYGSDDVFASKIVVITHILSLVTIPMFVWIQASL